MPVRRAIVVFALGFFALLAQTVLFREFLTAFEGNELGVGSFFGSWLLWVAIGALAGRVETRGHEALATRLEATALLYIPAFVVQHALIANARAIAGVQNYEEFPFAAMAAVAFVANAPLSFLTGLLFTLACRWCTGQARLPVARVYILETLGGCAGGVAVTVLLAAGYPGETAFLWGALALTLGLASARYAPALRFLPAGLCALALAAGVGGRWAERDNRAQWARLLPAQDYRGGFTTAQARYLFGERENQFVVMSGGGVCETLPGEEHAAEVMALHLAQKPDARRVMVIGSGGLGVCAAFTRIPGIERVTWLHPDPEYSTALLDVLPARFRPDMMKLEAPCVDIRAFLRGNTEGRFDLALVNLPDVTTLTLNQYCTRDFFSLLKNALADDGAASVRISGAANYLGGELAYLGGSMLATLESVFRHVMLKPGDESWMIASDGDTLSSFARGLTDRFAGIEGADAVYPPEAVLALYPADRVTFQMTAYRRALDDAPGTALLNTDRRPKALLFSLLLALRRAGWGSLASYLPVVFRAGLWVALCPIVLYGLLRTVYLLKSPRNGAHVSLYDGQFLVFSTGLAGMASSIVLMFVYQAQFGSLFLHIGLITALYMLGAFLGSSFVERRLARHAGEPRWLLPTATSCFLVLTLLVVWFPDVRLRAYFGVLFLVCGACMGTYVPIAAGRLHAAGRGVAPSGASLETLDHLGGAMGAVLTGLVLLPLFGTTATLGILAVLVAVNLGPFLVPREARSKGDGFERLTRPLGYAMVGVGACFVLASQAVAAAQAGQVDRRVLDAAKVMTSGADLEERLGALPRGAAFKYYEVANAPEASRGFIFGTAVLAGGISGYGGPITLAVYVDRDGILRDLRIVESRETPVYLDRLALWPQTLPGRNLLEPDPFADVDAVSGATMTSQAILRTLEASGRAFGAAVLGRQVVGTTETRRTWLPDRDFVCLAAFMSLAILSRFRPYRGIRRLLLLATLVVTGFLLNLQYATHQVMALLGGGIGAVQLNGPFFLALGVPLLVVIFGNVYCGYVCPFGALQELLGDLRPTRCATDPGKNVWRYGRAVKYVLLLLLVVLFAVTRDYAVLSADPLISVFSGLREKAAVLMAAVVALLGIVFRRFWCRNLCPAGAFLSLMNGLRPLRRRLPHPRPVRCDLGVQTASELDCLFCDRCRHETE